MATDQDWVAVKRVIRVALFEDRDVLQHPPTSEVEWTYLAETIADGIVGAFVLTPRVT